MSEATDTMRFDGRAVVVTGAGRGIGRAYALLLAERGANVVVNDLGTTIDGEGSSPQPADDVVAEVRTKGGIAVASQDSVATEAGARQIIAAAMENFGRLDGLINNAGILQMQPFAETTSDSLRRHLEIHVLGTFLMCQAAWPHLIRARSGRIVNTVTGGLFGMPDLCQYGAAKGAIFGFTRSLAVEGAVHGIGVNAIAPQAATRMLRAASLEPDLRQQLEETRPPSLVAPGGVFLAHESCELQGETLAVSAGQVSRIGLTENAGIQSDQLTPELIRDRLDAVMSDSTAKHWASSQEKYRASLE